MVALLLRIWDPIGVHPAVHAPANEYDSYAQRVLSIVQSGGDAAALAAFLAGVRATEMGLGAFPRRDRAVAIAIMAAVELLTPERPAPSSQERSVDFEVLPLHDAVLRSVVCDWQRGTCEIHVRTSAAVDPAAGDWTLRFTDVRSVVVDRNEPWGRSSCVNATSRMDDAFSIEMQSGDVIRVSAGAFVFGQGRAS